MHEVPLFAKNRYESVVPWKECDSKDRPPSEIAMCPRVGCGKRYGSSDSLKQHLRTHKNEIRLPDGRRKPAASTAAVTASTSVMADKSSKDKPVEMFTDFTFTGSDLSRLPNNSKLRHRCLKCASHLQ